MCSSTEAISSYSGCNSLTHHLENGLNCSLLIYPRRSHLQSVTTVTVLPLGWPVAVNTSFVLLTQTGVSGQLITVTREQAARRGLNNSQAASLGGTMPLLAEPAVRRPPGLAGY